MSAVIFNGPYAKVLASLGIKLKDDTLILHGVGVPVVTAPDGSVFLSTVGFYNRLNGVWVKLESPDIDINYLDVESWNKTTLSDSNITNVGCTLDTTSQVNGVNSLKAVHQAVSTYSIKKTISVSPKFRSRNVTLSLWGKSGATLGNVTILFRDETNALDIGVSQQVSLETTISNKVFSFDVPATCQSLSYKISYLPEAGAPETFIDDISILLTDLAPNVSQLVQEPDSMIKFNNFTVALGSTATKIFTLGTPLYQEIKGDALRYVKDPVNGDYFEALKSGPYSFSFGFDSGASASSSFGMGLSKNSTQLTTSVQQINASDKLTMGYFSDVPNINWTGLLSVGDKVRLHDLNHGGGGAGTIYNTFTASYSGSLKQLNPSNDSKMEIPTHTLRFEGASNRGLTDTFIVKFDSQTITKGDGFEVVNTPANGTVVTIKKNGILTVNTSILTADTTAQITLNQSVLTSNSTIASEILAVASNGASRVKMLSATVSVKVGDKIRVSNGSAPNPDVGNNLNLVLQEQSIPANFSNVLPQWSEGDSAIRVSLGNGFGSINTLVRRFSNVLENIGVAIEYIDSATLGGYFLIKESGLYNISYTDSAQSGQLYHAITKNQTTQIVNSNLLCVASSNSSNNNDNDTIATQVYLLKGDIIRGVVNTPSNTISTSGYASISISKVGKPNLSSVDVTPFVNLKLPDTNIVGEVIAYAGSNIPENFLDCAGQAVSRSTYQDLFNVIGVTHGSGDGSTTFNLPDYRGRFLRGVANGSVNDPDRASRTAMNTGGNTGDSVGSVQLDSLQGHDHTGGSGSYIGTTGGGVTNFSLDSAGTGSYRTSGMADDRSGASGTLRKGSETRPKNAYVRYLIRFKPNETGVATPTEQVSSDTMNFVFKSTPIVDSDPIGTFNTYTYPANSNTATLSTSAPTQTVSSMNTNGIQIFARAYNTASNSASPARVDIFIGKGLKSKQVDAYKNVGKSITCPLDYFIIQNTYTNGMSIRDYNETTGILTLDAGLTYDSLSTSAGFRALDNTYSPSAYVVFNASKSPSLVTIPNLAPRVAYISDVRVNGTAGGSATSATQNTRVLNTIVDSTGVITSLASNQFTLPAGTYMFEAKCPAYGVNTHQAKLRNVTDSIDSLIGSSSFSVNATGGMSHSIIEGELVLTSPKTFSIFHYTQTGVATNGLGTAVGAGQNEVYTQVKITRIK